MEEVIVGFIAIEVIIRAVHTQGYEEIRINERAVDRERNYSMAEGVREGGYSDREG